MKRMFFAVIGGCLLVAPAAFAKGGKSPSPTHHCMKDGSEVAGVTKKQCAKQGGKWEKKAAGDTAAAPTPGGTTP